VSYQILLLKLLGAFNTDLEVILQDLPWGITNMAAVWLEDISSATLHKDAHCPTILTYLDIESRAEHQFEHAKFYVSMSAEDR
jgi:hypothetical protein